MSVENVIQQLADTDKIHTGRVIPAAKATETAGRAISDMTHLDEHYRMPAAAGVVDAIYVLTASIREKIKEVQPETVDIHANHAIDGYTRIADGSANEQLADAVADSARCITNANAVRESAGELDALLHKLEGDILGVLAGSAIKLHFHAAVIEGAAQAIQSNGEQAVEASQAYAAQITTR